MRELDHASSLSNITRQWLHPRLNYMHRLSENRRIIMRPIYLIILLYINTLHYTGTPPYSFISFLLVVLCSLPVNTTTAATITHDDCYFKRQKSKHQYTDVKKWLHLSLKRQPAYFATSRNRTSFSLLAPRV